MTVESGVVEVDYHQFSIAYPETDTLAVVSEGSLFDSGDGFITVHTGVAAGPVKLTIAILSGPPAEDAQFEGWDNVAQGWLRTPGPLSVITTTGDLAAGFDSLTELGAGSFGIRVHSVGRARQWDAVVEEPTEHYEVRVWPSSAPVQERELKATDGVWADDAGARRDEPSLADGAADATVRLHGPVASPVVWH